MKHQLNVHFLPELVASESLAGSAAVVIDVLRATTVIVHALAAGATKVVPCLEVEATRRIAAELPAGEAVLGGERGGVLIEGFDLSNTPTEYTPARVGQRTVVFTTTNGTRAMHVCREADNIIIAAFVNLAAVCRSLQEADRIEIVCAGTNGKISREDVLAAGAIVAALGERYVLNDSANIARVAWSAATRPLAEELLDSHGGQNLTALGLAADIDTAAELDRFGCVPNLDPKRWEITLPADAERC